MEFVLLGVLLLLLRWAYKTSVRYRREEEAMKEKRTKVLAKLIEEKRREQSETSKRVAAQEPAPPVPTNQRTLPGMNPEADKQGELF